MKAFLALCALLLASFASGAATYVFTGNPYGATVLNFIPPCGTPSCANFTAAMRVSGTFSTSTRLAPNDPGSDIALLLSAGNFTDGLVTYAGNDPALRVHTFTVVTDANSNVIDQFIIVERWQDGTSGPHAVGDRFDYFIISPGGVTNAFHNRQCTALGAGPSGVPDTCVGDTADGSDSIAAGAAGPVFAFAPGSTIPTLGEYALLLLAALMGIAGVAGLRRKDAGSTAA